MGDRKQPSPPPGDPGYTGPAQLKPEPPPPPPLKRSDAEPEIRYLGDLQRLELKPGDRLVLTLPWPATCELVDRLRDMLQQWAPDVPVLVLEQGMTIGAVGPTSEVPSA